jgi:pimeloyl-ACP methyl ester carboxylesterase
MSYAKMYSITPETTLNVSFSGTQSQNPTLIFLHYWGGSSRTFSTVIAHLFSKFHCIAIDLRGWGSSSGPQHPYSYSIRDMASDIEALIPKLNINDFFLVGHSMGGKLVQLIAGRNVVKGLKGLILIAPAPPTPFELPPDMKETQISAYSTPASAEFVVRNVLSSSALSDETIKTLVEDMVKGNEFAKKAWPAYGMKEDILEDSRRINVPVLVIAGEYDRVEPPERFTAGVLGNIKAAEMVVIEGSGHLLPVEAPSKVAQSIAGFLDSRDID